MSDRAFSHPAAGKQVRIEQNGNEVSIILVVSDRQRADDIAERLAAQAQSGYVEFRLWGNVKSVEKTESAV